MDLKKLKKDRRGEDEMIQMILVMGIILYFFIGLIFCGAEVKWQWIDKIEDYLRNLAGLEKEEGNLVDSAGKFKIVTLYPLYLVAMFFFFSVYLIKIFVRFFLNGFRLPKKTIEVGIDKEGNMNVIKKAPNRRFFLFKSFYYTAYNLHEYLYNLNINKF